MDIRNLMTAIRVGCVAMRYDKEYCDALTDTVNYIDSHLRPARNRCVHDVWARIDENQVWRMSATPKVKDGGPPGNYRWVADVEVRDIPASEIEELVADIASNNNYLMYLATLSYNPPGFQFLSPLIACPERPLLHRHKGMQRQQAPARAKRKLPPKSSLKSREAGKSEPREP